SFWIYLVEKAPPSRTVVVPAPAETVEDVKPGAAPIWMPPFPGATASGARLDERGKFEVTLPSDKERRYVGPVLSWAMTGPADLSGHEFREVYVPALERAGWKVTRVSGGAWSISDFSFQAHYAQRNRDIWVSAHAGTGGA